MEPLPEGPATTSPDERLLRPRAIAAIEDLLREGRWETWLHPRLRERGFGLYCAAGWCSSTTRTSVCASSVSQRWHYSRSYAGMRTETLGRRRSLYALGAAVAAARALLAHGEERLLAQRADGGSSLLATPLILLYVASGRREKRSAIVRRRAQPAKVR